jgi:hypothetical protein
MSKLGIEPSDGGWKPPMLPIHHLDNSKHDGAPNLEFSRVVLTINIQFYSRKINWRNPELKQEYRLMKSV